MGGKLKTSRIAPRLPKRITEPVVRKLQPDEAPLFRDHLLRLDDESRYDRFNAPTEDLIIEQYAARCFATGAIVIAWLEGDAARGAAELHRSEETEGQGDGAFSVEKEYRRKGIGSALLLELIACAREGKLASLRITTQPQNTGMQALMLKFGAGLSLDDGEMVGVIALKSRARAATKPKQAAKKKPRAAPARR